MQRFCVRMGYLKSKLLIGVTISVIINPCIGTQALSPYPKTAFCYFKQNQSEFLNYRVEEGCIRNVRVVVEAYPDSLYSLEGSLDRNETASKAVTLLSRRLLKVSRIIQNFGVEPRQIEIIQEPRRDMYGAGTYLADNAELRVVKVTASFR